MSEGKECTKCKVWKTYSEFHWKDKKRGYRKSWCKTCRKCGSDSKDCVYRDKNPSVYRVCDTCCVSKPETDYSWHYKSKGLLRRTCSSCKLESDREYRSNNVESVRKYHSDYYKENKEALKEKRREYRNEWSRVKRKNDPSFRLRNLVSCAIRNALSNNNSSKEGNATWDALPYTPQQLREHLEAQFEEGMTWDNVGEWQIDHIYPQSKLPYESMTDENFRLAWDLKNLRPLWANENISKSDKIIEGAEELLLEIKKDLDNNSEA